MYLLLLASAIFRVIQINTLEDRNVTDKSHWDSALRFLEESLQSKISTNDSNLHEQVSHMPYGDCHAKH